MSKRLQLSIAMFAMVAAWFFHAARVTTAANVALPPVLRLTMERGHLRADGFLTPENKRALLLAVVGLSDHVSADPRRSGLSMLPVAPAMAAILQQSGARQLLVETLPSGRGLAVFAHIDPTKIEGVARTLRARAASYQEGGDTLVLNLRRQTPATEISLRWIEETFSRAGTAHDEQASQNAVQCMTYLEPGAWHGELRVGAVVSRYSRLPCRVFFALYELGVQNLEVRLRDEEAEEENTMHTALTVKGAVDERIRDRVRSVLESVEPVEVVDQLQYGTANSGALALEAQMVAFFERSPIAFEGETAQLTTRGRVAAARAMRLLLQHPEARIELSNYVVMPSQQPGSMTLALERARSLRRLWVQHGVASERILVRGIGKAAPSPTGRPWLARAR